MKFELVAVTALLSLAIAAPVPQTLVHFAGETVGNVGDLVGAIKDDAAVTAPIVGEDLRETATSDVKSAVELGGAEAQGVRAGMSDINLKRSLLDDTTALVADTGASDLVQGVAGDAEGIVEDTGAVEDVERVAGDAVGIVERQVIADIVDPIAVFADEVVV